MSQTKPVVLNLSDDQLRALDYALRNIAYGRFRRKEHKDLCEQIIAQLPLFYPKG
jgi:hypothetical protein